MGSAKAPVIIPIFLPHQGCHHRCIFCNQRALTEEIPSPHWVQQFIESSLPLLTKWEKSRENQIAFYGGSFTQMDPAIQRTYLNTVRPFLLRGQIQSIRISTRPDALRESNLSLLKEHGVKTIEIGVQSMSDEVLLLSQRAHTKEDTISAILRVKQWGFEVGIHLMLGLLGDTPEGFLSSIDQVISLRPDFIRIHPTLVLRGAPLETLWARKVYRPPSFEETICLLKKAVLRLEKASLPIARIGLQPSKELEESLLAGPYHPALHYLIDSAIFYEMAQRLLEHYPDETRVVLLCHPKDGSKLRGLRNENIFRLREHFRLREILVEEREDLRRGVLLLRTYKGDALMDRALIEI